MGRIGIPADFINGPLKDFGRTVRYFRVKKVVSNIEGDETINPGPPEDLLVVLYPITVNTDDQGREGLVEQGDAKLFSLPASDVHHNDIVEWEGRFYRLGLPVRRYASEEFSDPLYDYTILFLHEALFTVPEGRFIGTLKGIPENARQGDWWYDTIDRQYKGYDNENVVILG